MRGTRWRGFCAWGILWLAMGFDPSAFAQPRVVPVPAGRFEPSTAESASQFVTNRELARRLESGSRRIADGEYLIGIRFLQSLLDESEDWFVANKPQEQVTQEAHFRSLKHQASEQLGRLNEEARRIYEQEYGLVAHDLLKAAILNGDRVRLQEISRRFFHTKAGREATYRLGLMLADQGDPVAAAFQLQRLARDKRSSAAYQPQLSLALAVCWDRAGLAEQSQDVLKSLVRKFPNRPFQFGGRKFTLSVTNPQLPPAISRLAGSSTETLSEWMVFRGNPGRNALATKASPVGPIAWSRSTIREDSDQAVSRGEMKRMEVMVRDLMQERESDPKLLPVPVAQPLLVGNLAICRTLQSLHAIDLATGELRWKTSHIDPVLRPILQHPRTNPDVPTELPVGRGRENMVSPLQNLLVQRTWRDTTFGMIAGDRERVYCLEDLGLMDGNSYLTSGLDDPLRLRMHNKMMAFDVQSGTAKWEAGGPPTSDKNSLGGTFFLGAPLPVGEELYCLGEKNNEISLFILDAKTGRKLWEQRLLNPSLDLLANRERRTMGLAPAFRQGIVICPTASGAVVAVDVSQRILLWAYRYPSTHTEDTLITKHGWQQGRNFLFPQESLDPEVHWADTVPVISDGHVLITPSDSNSLFCLDFVTGSLKWELPREDGVYLAGVFEGKAILVARDLVRAVRLSDGKPAWERPTPISLPAGRGIIAESRFHLPMHTGEVASIDLKTGELLARTRLPGLDAMGNWVSANGQVVFQSTTRIGAFQSWEELQRHLSKNDPGNSADGDTLRLKGAIHLHLGEQNKGLNELVRAWKIAPQESTRETLVTLLLNRLRSTPNPPEAWRDQLSDLVRTPEERMAFIHASPHQMDSAESRERVLFEYLELAISLGDTDELYRIDDFRRVRADRWIAARIQELSAKATPEEFARWNDRLAKAWQGEWSELSDASRSRVLSVSPDVPFIGETQLAKLEELKKYRSVPPARILLQTAKQLNQLRRSRNPKIARTAAEQLVNFYLTIERTEEAYLIAKSVSGEWPASWKQAFQASPLKSAPKWPERSMTAEYRKSPVAVLEELPVRLVQANKTYLTHWQFAIDRQRHWLIARDENGFERWHFDLAEVPGAKFGLQFSSILVDGNHALVWFPNQFFVLDLLTRKHTPRMLWAKTFPDSELDFADTDLTELSNSIPDRLPFFAGNKVGWLEKDKLTFVEATSGKTLWVRRSVASGSILRGTTQHLVVLNKEQTVAEILGLTDGVRIRKVPLLPRDTQEFFEGTKVFATAMVDGKRQLECRDLVTGKQQWAVPFPEKAELQKVGFDEIAILEITGQLNVYSKANGKITFQTNVGPEPKLAVGIRDLAECRLVMVDRGTDANPRFPIFEVEVGSQGFLLNGMISGFHRDTGKLLWTAKFANQRVNRMPPYHSPVMIFNTVNVPRGGFTPPKEFLQILDVRSGKLIYEQQNLPRVSPWSLKISPERESIEMSFYRGQIEMTFPR